MPARLYQASFPFLARGAHPTAGGTPITVPSGEISKMASINGVAAVLSLSGSSHAGVLEFAQPGAATLSVPSGEVVSALAVEVVARIAPPITYVGDPRWIVELYDSRTSGSVGATRQSLSIPIAGTLVGSIAGGADAWGIDQATFSAALAANALRIRLISPVWSASSAGSLQIDGVELRIDSNLAPAANGNRVRHRRSATPGRRPALGILEPGEIGIQEADRQLYAGNGAGEGVPFLAARFWTPDAAYAADDVVLYQRQWYYAAQATGPGPWNSAHWTGLTAANALTLGGRGLDTLFWYIAPLGMPFPWPFNAALIPSNWRVCNGENGTIDLRTRFLEGAWDDDALGATGTGWSGTTGGTALTVETIGLNIVQTGVGSGSDRTVLRANPEGGGLAVDAAEHTHAFEVAPRRRRVHWICRVS